MSRTHSQFDLQEFAARLAKLEQENKQLHEELATLRAEHTPAKEQPIVHASSVSSMPGIFTSDVAGTPAVSVTGTNGAVGADISSDTNTAPGIAVKNTSNNGGFGIQAASDGEFGIAIFANSGLGVGLQASGGGQGVNGNSTSGTGVLGNSSSGTGVLGESSSGTGIQASSFSGVALMAQSSSGTGVHSIAPTAGYFEGKVGIGTAMPSSQLSVVASYDGDGIELIGSQSQTKDAGVTFVDEAGQVGNLGLVSAPNAWMMGTSPGDIVLRSEKGGVVLGSGEATATPVLYVLSNGNVGIGTTDAGARMQVEGGAYGITSRGIDVGIYTQNITVPENTVYLATNALAGDFYGDVRVSGDVLLTGADCAEEFEVGETGDIEPGTVMVLDQEGRLQQSHQAYDKRVAGVISGAGDYRPGLILDRQQLLDSRVPVALVGKVYCKVDAQYAPIEVGDLLTTSPSHGCAMKATDPSKAFGSVLGKALAPLEQGDGLIPILVALQ